MNKHKALIRILGILFLIVIVSCNEQPTEDSKKIQSKLGKFDSSNTDNPDIFGKWTMCSSSYDSITIQYNVCPIIKFKYDWSGSVGDFLIEKEKFNWKLKDNILEISYPENASKKTFPDTFYYAYFYKKKEGFDLRINHIKHDYSFSLSR